MKNMLLFLYIFFFPSGCDSKKKQKQKKNTETLVITDTGWVVVASTAVCRRSIHLSMFKVHSQCMVWLVWLSRGLHRHLNGFHFSDLFKAGHHQQRYSWKEKQGRVQMKPDKGNYDRINSRKKIIMILGMISVDEMIWAHMYVCIHQCG